MAKKDFLKAKDFCVLILLSMFFILYPLYLFGEDVKNSQIEVKDNLISLDVKDADLSWVLKELEQKTGVKISIGKELFGKKITKNFKNVDLEKALKVILGENYIFIFSKDLSKQEKFILKEVKTGAAIGSVTSQKRTITIDIPYGKGKGEVGSISAGEGANIGPKSFAVDDKGNIYICDTVNNRIQIFSSSGDYISTMSLKKGIFVEDIALDSKGYIYIYDGVIGELYQYDKNGNINNKATVNERRWMGRGEMHIRNNKIYVDASDQTNMLREFLIAEIINNSLLVPKNEQLTKPIDKGYGETGKRYKFKNFIKGENVEVEIIDRDGTSSKTVSFPLEGIDSVEFFGEDQKQNFYIKTNSNVDGKLIMDVHKFNADGDYINSIQMPKGDINFWSIKNYSIGKDGAIYQFLPEKDKLRLNILHSE